MQINVNDHIGAYYIDVATGKWSIIGASDEMNEALNNKLKNNTVYYDEYVSPNAVLLEVDSTPITSENYADFRKATGVMPKHCYGTSFGYTQLEKIKQKLKDYYLNQTVTKDELKEYFKDCCKDMRVVLAQERKTTGLNVDDNIQIILDTYEQFRMSNSVMAKVACNEEGKKIAKENGWNEGDDQDWIYYNADFYYESEELRALFKEAAQELADEWGCGEIDTSTRDSDKLLSCSSSFNEAWKQESEYGARICSMLDVSKQPPQNFYFFFRESIEESGDVGVVLAGIAEKTEISKKLIFSIYDETQKQLPQFYHLAELLRDDISEDTDSLFKNYLSNFDIFTRYYGTIQMRN